MSIFECMRSEWLTWKKREIAWLAAAAILVASTSLITEDTPLGMTAALSGTLYTLFAGKGKRYCYFFGVINCVSYAVLSYQWRLYGEAVLYGIYYLPMMFAGFLLWGRAMTSGNTVRKTGLGRKGRLWGVILCVAAIVAVTWVFDMLGGRTPWLDSTTNVLSAAAMILTVKRCVEQWYLWMAVNAASIIIWANVWLESGTASAVAVMYAVWLASAVIFCIDWRKEMKNE